MSISKLINEIISEWSYRVNDGMPDAKNPTHLKELGIVLKEMGLYNIKDELIENLLTEKGKTPAKIKEADSTQFSNPILNKSIKYKNAKGEDAEGFVGNLLRLPADHPGRQAAERLLPADGTPERDKMNQDLGGQGQPQGAEKPEDKKGDEEGGAPKEDPIKQAAAMFDPKADPAMAARLDKERETLAKLASAEKGEDKEEQPKEDEKDSFNPIGAQDVSTEMPQADPDTFGGGSDIPDGVEPAELEQFNTDIKRVAELVAKAKENGEPAPDINLCDVTVPGTNLYCDDNLGIPRSEMPQFKGKAQPGSRAASMDADASGEVDTEPVFKEMLKQKGIKTLQTEVPADKLKATQKDLVGAKVVGMMGALEKDPKHPKITAPIYVSRDGYVIDGHHRWAAIVAYNAAHPDSQIQMKTTVLDMDIKDAIPMANKFAEDMGIAAKKADANKEDAVQPKAAEVKPNESDPTSNVKTFKGESSGKEIKTLEFDGGGFLFGTQHDNNKMADDIINQVKATIPKEKWKDIVFVGEGGTTGKDGEIEFNQEMDYAAPKFKEMGASIDTWDGDDLDVHKPESNLYKSQEQQTGLSQSKIKAGNWASMIGQGEGTDSMSQSKFLDDEGKEFLQSAAEEAGFPPIENWDDPTEQDIDTLYRLSFPEDEGDVETKVNDVQVAFNKARDLNLIKKQKELSSQGKIPIVMAGESHADLVNDIMKGSEDGVPTDKLPEPKEPSKEDGGVVYSLGGGYYSDTPGGPAQYVTTENVVTKVLIEGDSSWAYMLFEAVVVKKTARGKTVKLNTIEPGNQKKATAKAAAAEEPTGGSVTNNGPAVTANIAPDEDPTTGKGAKEIDSKKFNSKKFTESTIRQEQAFDNVEAAYPKIKRHDYQYPKGVDTYLKKVMHPAAFEAMDTLLKLSKGGDFVPPISMVTDQYGAGKISAQMNELCMQAVMAFPPTKEGIAARNAFIESLRENNRNIVKSKQTPILDDTWIDEFEGASDAFNGAMDRQYGAGNWKVVGTTWDVRSQNEDRGINYDDKGFSTDINIQVEASGKRENVEISCKKDWKIFLLNAGLGDAENWYYTLGPEKEKRAMDLMQKAAAKIKLSKEEIAELKSLSEEALSKAPVSNKKLQEDQYKSAQKGAEVIDGIETKELSRIYKQWIAGDYEGGTDKKGKVKSVKDPDFTLAAIKAHMKVGITNEAEFHAEMKRMDPSYKPTKKYYKKAVVCINNMLAQTKTDDDAMAWHKSHMNITTKFIQDAAQTLVKDKEYRKMLLRKLQEAIPLKTMTEGVETMQIDSMYITQEHMRKLFGTTDWKDIRQYLDVQVINGEGVLVYKAKGKATSQPISIAKIGIREKGRGYDGNPALEVKPSDEFQADMRRIEKELQSERN
jgi:hypothetical protein